MPDSSRKKQFEQLLHAINHDLRSPLANIRSATSILLQNFSDPLTDDQRAFIEIIDRAAICLLDQSNRLMLLNQIAFTQIKLKPTRLSELIANAKRELKNSYDIDTVKLIIDGDPELSCDSFTMAATLALLVAGDTKHKPDPLSGIPPTIHTKTQPDQLCFTIDSLMSADRLAQSLVELASAIVERHGGQLDVSQIDGQKQFAFCLPI